jgi:hypothetical protein
MTINMLLDRAALDHCLAEAFHPGCEVTWPIRHLSLFSSPFRIRHRPSEQPKPDYGKTLTPGGALVKRSQGPGDLTRWMGLPWQADTAFCRSGYDSDYDPYVPTFWPARVPNQILTKAAYEIIRNDKYPASDDSHFTTIAWNGSNHWQAQRQARWKTWYEYSAAAGDNARCRKRSRLSTRDARRLVWP